MGLSHAESRFGRTLRGFFLEPKSRAAGEDRRYVPRPSRKARAWMKVKRGASPRRLVWVAIGLGANLGNVRRAILTAARALSRVLRAPRLSHLYRTSPVGGPAQPDFLNAALVGKTTLSAEALLTLLRKLETAAGREPGGTRNAPRPLDLDLLLYGSRRVATPRLQVPHPLMTSRLFVLVPLADIAPRRVVPGTGKTVARFLAEARRRSTESVRRARASF